MIPIIVLNLERAVNRKENMIKQFDKLGLTENTHYFFMPAYDGAYLSNFSFNMNIGIGYGTGRKFQKAEVAIIMSQMAAIKFAQMMNFENVIILEDDVILCEDWVQRIDTIIESLPENWEHAYLSGHSDYVKFKEYDKLTIEPAPKMVGAFSYLLNKRSYSKICKHVMSCLTTYDDLIMYIISENKLKSFVCFPFLAFHNANDSFVWDGTAPGHLSHENNMHSSYKYFKNKL